MKIAQFHIPNLIALKTRSGSSKKLDLGGNGVAIKPVLKCNNPVKKSGMNDKLKICECAKDPDITSSCKILHHACIEIIKKTAISYG
jgi:hypothetical protein